MEIIWHFHEILIAVPITTFLCVALLLRLNRCIHEPPVEKKKEKIKIMELVKFHFFWHFVLWFACFVSGTIWCSIYRELSRKITRRRVSIFGYWDFFQFTTQLTTKVIVYLELNQNMNIWSFKIVCTLLMISKASRHTSNSDEFESKREKIASISKGKRVIRCIGNIKNDCIFKDWHTGLDSSSFNDSTNLGFSLEFHEKK